MTIARLGYAQARVQARFGDLPDARDFRLLDASRDAAHFLEALRVRKFARYAPGLGPGVDSDGLEARLRAQWRALCAEVAGWYDAQWREAFHVFSAYPDLAILEYLRAGGAVANWILGDPRLAQIARGPSGLREGVVTRTYGAALGRAFSDDRPLGREWSRGWRRAWPTVERKAEQRLLQVAREMTSPDVASAPTALDVRSRLERLFRRSHMTAVAAFAYLAIVAVVIGHIRGGHAARLLPPPVRGWA